MVAEGLLKRRVQPAIALSVALFQGLSPTAFSAQGELTFGNAGRNQPCLLCCVGDLKKSGLHPHDDAYR